MKEEQMLRKWQARLGLSDWDISLKTADYRIMENASAKTHIRESLQIAEVYVLEQGDRRSSDAGVKDFEVDLVHELIHIRLWAVDRIKCSDVEQVLKEQAIDWLARALVAADRS